MIKRIKDYAIDFIKEIVAVIAGILIALFIDNWNDERKDRNYIDQVFSIIHSELRETSKDIEETVPSQKILIDSLEFYSGNEAVSIFDIVVKSGGIYKPTIRINAWKSVSSSKIDLISYKKIVSLSNIEEQKEILKGKSDFLVTVFYSNIYENSKSKKETLKLILLDMVQTEETIQQHIVQFEKE